MNSTTQTQGFTLIEVLISLAILGVIMAAVMSLLPSLATTNSASRNEQRAVLAAKSYFENVRAEYARLGAPAGQGFDKDPTTIALDGTGDGLTCTRKAAEVRASAPLTNGGAAVPILKRVSLDCTIQSRTYTFALDLPRPGL